MPRANLTAQTAGRPAGVHVAARGVAWRGGAGGWGAGAGSRWWQWGWRGAPQHGLRKGWGWRRRVAAAGGGGLSGAALRMRRGGPHHAQPAAASSQLGHALTPRPRPPSGLGYRITACLRMRLGSDMAPPTNCSGLPCFYLFCPLRGLYAVRYARPNTEPHLSPAWAPPSMFELFIVTRILMLALSF